jgi:hypothetical protein
MTDTKPLFDGPKDAPVSLVLAHGAGAPMDSPFMAHMAEGLGARGLRIARFEFPYMAARRRDGKKRPPDRAPVLLESWRAVIAELGGPGGGPGAAPGAARRAARASPSAASRWAAAWPA